MRFQQYETPKLSLGAVALVAAIIPILLGYFLVTGFANNPAYTGLGAGPSTASTSSGASSIIKVSMPAGAGNPNGAPGYAPDMIKVVIGVNASVLFENNDTVAHTVTSVSGNGSMSSGNMNPGAIFLYNFTTPGTYDYVCAYHPWMTGTVVVVGSSSATAPSIVQVSIPVGAGNPSGAPGYAPDILNITTGTTVVWTNNDNGIDHTVTSASGNGSSLNSGNMDPGAKYNYTFTSPGTYDYICVYHSWMKGVVVVKAASGPTTNSTGSSGSSAGVKVTIPSGAGNPSGAPGYSPDKIKVVIGVNNSVTWTNDDTAGAGTAHTVTSVSGNGSINSGNMPAGATYTYVFTTPGTYNYYCVYHSWMTGTVVVVAGASSSSSGSASASSSSSSGSSSSSSGSSSSSSTATSSSSSTSGASLNGIKVSIPSGAGNPSGAPGYAPDKITVVIGVNNTVTWTNNDGTTDHTVTSTSVPTGASKFDSGNMGPGATFSYTFTTPGTYQYDCTYHSWMIGTVVVIQG